MPFVRGDILGGSYQGRSLAAANSRCINLYPERARNKATKGPGVLYSCPGLVEHFRVDSSPIRAMAASQDTLYVLAGSSLYAAKGGVVPVTDATAKQDSSIGLASLVVNDSATTTDGKKRIQVGLADGGSWCVYTYDVADSAKLLTRAVVLGEDGNHIRRIWRLGFTATGVFISNSSNKVWTTESYDLATVSGLSYGVAGLHLGTLNACAQLNQEVWLFSPLGCEVWYDAGTFPFPLARRDGVSLEVGCLAPWSLQTIGGSLMWLGRSARGDVSAYITDGYKAQSVTPPEIVYEWDTYPSPEAAVACTYAQGGHLFYVLTFPQVGRTWCYDVTEQEWHERATYINGQPKAHPVAMHVPFNGLNLVANFNDNIVGKYTLESWLDYARPRPWVRSWRFAQEPQVNPVAYSSLRVDLETGITAKQGDSPTMALRWSDDGGMTWSNYHHASMGRVGETRAYCKFNRLGATRHNTGLDRIFELSSASDVQAALLGVTVEIA